MKRRGLFKRLIAAAVGLSAKEPAVIVAKKLPDIILPPEPRDLSALDKFFIQDANRLINHIAVVGRRKGRMSALIHKDTLPENAGYNYTGKQADH